MVVIPPVGRQGPGRGGGAQKGGVETAKATPKKERRRPHLEKEGKSKGRTGPKK